MQRQILLTLIFISLIVSGCAATSYIGDRQMPTTNVDIFYAAKDVKKEYKVIGHIYALTSLNAESVKNSIVAKAKSVGADGVIILGITSTGGKDGETIQQADAIQYLTK